MTEEAQATGSAYNSLESDSREAGGAGSTSVTDATLSARVGGYLIDNALVIGLAAVPAVFTALPVFSGVLLGFLYFLFRDSLPFLKGQSIGKKLLRIQAVSEDGSSLSGKWISGFLRNAGLLIPLFPIMEYVTLLNRRESPQGLRRLGDEWAGTIVIEVNRKS